MTTIAAHTSWMTGRQLRAIARQPALPLELGGKRLPKRADPPAIGEHGRELLAGLGCSPREIDALLKGRVVAFP